MFVYAVYGSKEDNSNPDAHAVALYVASRDPGIDNDQEYYREMITEEIYPGCFVDPSSFEVIRRPMFKIDKHEPSANNCLPEREEGYEIYKAVDGTTINLYTLDGEIWRMATYNSWDISQIKEYSETYIQYFMETLKRKGIDLDLDSLDKDKMYPFTFSNPRVHLMARDYAIYYWGGDDLADYAFDKPDRLIGNYATDSFIVRGEDSVDVYVSRSFRRVSDVLYDKRKEFARSSDSYKEAIFRQAFSILCNRTISQRDMDLIFKYINTSFYRVLNEAERMMKLCETETVVNGVPVPDRVLNETNPTRIRKQVRDYKTIASLIKMAV